METANAQVQELVSSVAKSIGMEKLVVRIFRQVFGRAVLEAGILKPTLDEFLRATLEHPDAKKGDRDQAHKVYSDMLTWTYAMTEDSPHPPPAPPQDVGNGLTGDDIQIMFEGLDEKPMRRESIVEDVSLDDFAPFQDERNNDPLLNALLDTTGQLHSHLQDFANRTEHPFLRSFYVLGSRYIALGTMFGNAYAGKFKDQRVNVNCTVNPYTSLSKVPADIMVFKGGKALCLRHENERGVKKFLFCLRHKPGRKIRYWVRVNEEDKSDLARFIILTDDCKGWKEATRAEF